MKDYETLGIVSIDLETIVKSFYSFTKNNLSGFQNKYSCVRNDEYQDKYGSSFESL